MRSLEQLSLTIMQTFVVCSLIGLFLIASTHGKSVVKGKSKVVYVKDKHAYISVEGCATPDLVLGFFTPMKVRFCHICFTLGHCNEPLL